MTHKITIILLLFLPILITSGCIHEGGEPDDKSSITYSNLTLLRHCEASLSQCSSIVSEYGGSINVLEKGIFDDSETAKVFFELWKGKTPHVQGSIYAETTWTKDYPSIDKLQYPTVLFALGFNGRLGSVPYVAFCNANGSLFIKSEVALGCE